MLQNITRRIARQTPLVGRTWRSYATIPSPSPSGPEGTGDLKDVKGKPELNQFQSTTPSPSTSTSVPVSSSSASTNGSQQPLSSTAPPVFFQSEKPPEPFKPMASPATATATAATQEPPKQPLYRYVFYALAFMSVAYIGLDLVEALTPSNTDFISEETLAIIGKAIDAESNKRVQDAITHYIEALKQLDSEDCEHISPCYTSCAVRIAQLYEHERQFDKAIAIYKELSECYLNAFADRNKHEILTQDESYDFAILRSLTIAMRYAYLLPEKEVNKAREVLLYNIVEAHQRIIEHYPPFLSILNDINNRNILDLITADMEKAINHLPQEEQDKIIQEQTKTPIELPLYTTEKSDENQILGLHVKAWPVFTRVLINAKDMYANLSLECQDLPAAISNLTSNSLIIQRCFDHPSRLTMTLTKLGIVLQMTYQTINAQFPQGEDIEIIQDNKPVKVNLSSPQLKNYVLNSTISETKRIFSKVLSLCDNIKKQERAIRENHMGNDIGQWESMFKPALEKSEMVSSASLGIISYHTDDMANAMKYFKRAKGLAYKLNDTEYIEDINAWIALLD
jgi:tetratricopeptide (TPR) repeat protein